MRTATLKKLGAGVILAACCLPAGATDRETPQTRAKHARTAKSALSLEGQGVPGLSWILGLGWIRPLDGANIDGNGKAGSEKGGGGELPSSQRSGQSSR